MIGRIGGGEALEKMDIELVVDVARLSLADGMNWLAVGLKRNGGVLDFDLITGDFEAIFSGIAFFSTSSDLIVGKVCTGTLISGIISSKVAAYLEESKPFLSAAAPFRDGLGGKANIVIDAALSLFGEVGCTVPVEESSISSDRSLE
jgi:hypothetical protein